MRHLLPLLVFDLLTVCVLARGLLRAMDRR